MAAKATAFANDLLKLIFQNIPLPGIGDAGGLQPSAAAGMLWLSLHTADPGVDGDQSTNEVDYPGYTRVGVIRDETGWTVVDNKVSPATLLSFPIGTGTGANQMCPVGVVGTDETGPGKILYRGAFSPPVTTGPGISPQIPTTSVIREL
jgi:hypothetical protein